MSDTHTIYHFAESFPYVEDEWKQNAYDYEKDAGYLPGREEEEADPDWGEPVAARPEEEEILRDILEREEEDR